MRKTFKNWMVRDDGATAIESAVVFPILCTCLFGVFTIGQYLMAQNMAQRYVEKSGRIARMMDDPTKSELEAMLADNVNAPMFGSYSQTVSITTTETGARYANLNVGYTYRLELPFIEPINLGSESNTRVPLRNLPG